MTKTVTWKCYLDDSTISRYDMIIGRDLLTALGLELKFYDPVIVGSKSPYEGCLSPMVDMINYDYAHLTDKIVNL